MSNPDQAPATLNRDQVLAVMSTTLSIIRTHVDSRMPSSRLATLIAVMSQPGIAQEELAARAAPANASSISRNIQELTQYTHGEQPLDLVRVERNPEYRKQQIVHPTEKAEQLFGEILQAVNKELAMLPQATSP